VFFFRPARLWAGSANWTVNARRSWEFGLWTDDPGLLGHATESVLQLLASSEPPGSVTATPTPDLLPVDYDDAAFAAYLAEVRASDPDFDDR
jgi:hypothetical protein